MTLLLETLLSVGQNVLNYALSLDEQAQRALINLDQRCIALHIEKLKQTLYVQIDDQALYFSLHPPQQVDLKISAQLSELWSLSQKTHTPAQHVQMQGNMHIAQQLSKIVQDFSPDWEEALTAVTGDVAGHALAQIFRHAHTYAKQLASTLLQNGADYIVDEKLLVAPKVSIDDFIDQVSQLRTAADRLHVQINLCKTRV